MATGIGITFLMILVLAYWRSRNQKYVQLKYKYKLYALRDKVIKQIIKFKTTPKEWG